MPSDNKVIKYSNFTPSSSNVTFSEVKVNAKGGKKIFVSYNGAPILIQLPKMGSPFGVNRSKYGDATNFSGPPKCSVSFGNMDEHPELKELHDKLTSVENIVKKEAQTNSNAWFKKKKMSMETINEFFKSSIKQSKDKETNEPNGKYPDTFDFKIIEYNGQVQTTFFSNDKHPDTKKPVELDSAVFSAHRALKGAQLKVILKLNSVWIVDKKFGCTWDAESMIVFPTKTLGNDYAFIDESDNEEDLQDYNEEHEEQESSKEKDSSSSESDDSSDSDSDSDGSDDDD